MFELERSQRIDRGLQDCLTQQRRHWSHIEQAITDLGNLDTDDDTPEEHREDTILDRIDSLLDQLPNVGLRIDATSPIAQAVKARYENGFKATDILFVLFISEDRNNDNNRVNAAVEKRIIESVDYASEFETERRVFALLRNQWANDTAEFHDSFTEANEQWKKFFRHTKKTIATKEKQLSLLYTNSEKELEAIAKAYDEQLSLEAPVTYWRDKTEKHKDRAKISPLHLLAWLFCLSYLWLSKLPCSRNALSQGQPAIRLIGH